MSAGSALASEIPIELRDGLVWTRVQCKGTTLNFVVDTGAASTVVSVDAAQKSGVKCGSSISVAGVGSQARGFRVNDLDGSVAGIDLPRNAVALDLRAPSHQCTQPIDGLIGADFFKGKIVQIDYAHRVMRCLDRATEVGGALPMKFQNGVICVPVAVNGCAPRWTRVDTGCTDELHWAGAGTKWSRASAPLSVALAASSKARTRLPVEVGAERLGTISVTLHAKEIFPGEAGLLGNGVLSKYRVTIDGVKNRLALER